MKKIAVIGCGYVGTGMLRMFARCPDFHVIGYDPSCMGTSLAGQAWNYYETSRRDEIQGADLAVICVPTPQGSDGRADLSAVEEVSHWVDAELIVVKSTVPPGTIDNFNMWMTEKGLEQTWHFSPEYMGEPTNYVPSQYPDPREPWKHDFCIVGGPRASEVLDYFARVMATSVRMVACSALEAELAKYMENSYLATKVTFCNEWAMIAAHFDVDYKRLRELWLLDSRVEPDHTMVFIDKPGFGGKCLPKDLSAIVAAAVDAGYAPTLLRAVLDANRRMRNGEPQFERVPDPQDPMSMVARSVQSNGGAFVLPQEPPTTPMPPVKPTMGPRRPT